jgi:hypothetical protein
MGSMNTVLHYVAANGRDIFAEWVAGLKDMKAKAAIDLRIGRMEEGNFGDSKPVREGVSESTLVQGTGFITPAPEPGSSCSFAAETSGNRAQI